MSYSLAALLFQSKARSSVLELLFVKRLQASLSELARRTNLSAKAVTREVGHLRQLGLVLVETVAAADVARANFEHPVAKHLRALLEAPATPPENGDEATRVRESLVAWGAPLAGVQSEKHYPLEETLLRGLAEAQRDGTVLRVLPTLFLLRASEVDWRSLKELARKQKLKSRLGMMVELTAELAGRSDLGDLVEDLRDRREKRMHFFPDVKSAFEAELAKRRSPEVAKRWGFWMNMSEQSFKSTLDQHRA